ncbi:pyridoxamine 5'-phosphate oxidase family protein [Acetanaerobacterium elongatum]|uniref:Nitroimidazol reductase NimA, pyridoxamine 5'-phosphate oxidase superfamily n=1 Tax=Acetanaerobacterium elongatum TaxID=258515 RepID=A0A1H0FT91_9FIRM|nr:pyridoxamine 5'-phosphate oxidase family protein [Acetanaerobacterium elongatum]SDN97761.1 hypothetical protein SAMN05192585_14310 [Acetanaerobacterium elongatum]
MPRKQRLTSAEEAKEILRAGEFGVLCTASAGGQPYGVPINYCYSEAEGCIYLHCAVTGKKLDNLAQNNKVSFVVTTRSEILADRFTTLYESAVVTGTAIVIEEETEKLRVLGLLCDRLSPGVTKGREEMIHGYVNETRIIRITIEELSGKRHNPA